MKIVYLHSSAELYGSDRSLLNICIQLVGRSGWTITVLLPTDGPLRQALEDLGVEVHILRLAVARRMRFLETAHGIVNARKVSRLVRDYDIVHANTIAVLNPLIISRVKVVYHVRETLGRTVVERALATLVARRSSAVIVPSKDTATRFEHAALTTAETFIVPNALPSVLRSFCKNLRVAPPGHLRIACIGRFNSWKGQELLARAFSEIASRRPNLELVLAGGPPPGDLVHYERVRSILAPLAEQVSFLGEVESGESVMRECDIVVVPSTKPEPFGLVVLEGLRAGCAVIASNSGGPAEIISHNQDGLLFESGNLPHLVQSIERVVDDFELRRRLQKAGQLRAQDYTPESTVDAIVCIYRSLRRSSVV